MTSQKKILANRRNAQKSTGPRTAYGKRCSARNGFSRHGDASRQFVVDGVENERLYCVHVRHVLRDLDPVGAIETELARRAAALLWRLRRVARYEAALGGIGVHHAESAVAASDAWQYLRASTDRLDATPAAARKFADQLLAASELLVRLSDMDDQTDLDPPLATFLVKIACDSAGIAFRSDVEGYPGLGHIGLYKPEQHGWSVRDMRKAFSDIARRAEGTVDAVLRNLSKSLVEAIPQAEARRQVVNGEVERQRLASVLPEARTLERLGRYESSLARTLHQTLRELTLLRAGRATAAPQVMPPVNGHAHPPAGQIASGNGQNHAENGRHEATEPAKTLGNGGFALANRISGI